MVLKCALLSMCLGIMLTTLGGTGGSPDVPPSQEQSESENIAAELPEDAMTYADATDFVTESQEDYPAATFSVQEQTEKKIPRFLLVIGAVVFGIIVLSGISVLAIRRFRDGIY